MSDDPRMREFFRSLLHTAIHGLLYRSLWGLPMAVSLFLLAALIGIVYWFQLY